MEFEYHDWRRLLDTYTVPDGISNGYTDSDTHANGYGCAYVDADSFCNPNRNAHGRT
jgi:hypothetical protein